MREYIRTANINSLVDIMSENNEKVRDILDECIKKFDDWTFIRFCLTLDDMNIRGNQIEYIYYEYYQGDYDKFISGVNAREQNMLGSLNSTYLSSLNDHERTNQKACKSGAERTKAFFMSDNKNNKIRIVDIEGDILFELNDKDWLIVENYSNTKKRESQFEYLDDYHFRCDGIVYHCLEFAVAIEINNYHIYPSNRKYNASGRTIARNNKDCKKFQRKGA